MRLVNGPICTLPVVLLLVVALAVARRVGVSPTRVVMVIALIAAFALARFGAACGYGEHFFYPNPYPMAASDALFGDRISYGEDCRVLAVDLATSLVFWVLVGFVVSRFLKRRT